MSGKIDKSYTEFNDYKESIIHKNRYFVDEKYKKYFDCYIEENIKEELAENTFYRARINQANQELPYDEKNIRMPSKEVITSSGRCNPKGINYFYVGNNLETACTEVRPTLKDEITVGVFKNRKNLKIVELGNIVSMSSTSVYEVYKETDEDKIDLISKDVVYFMLYFSLDFSQVIRNEDDHQYAPYQYFAEYCKMKGIDGIKFHSSLMYETDENMNYVFFSDSEFDLENTFIKKTQRLKYNFDD